MTEISKDFMGEPSLMPSVEDMVRSRMTSLKNILSDSSPKELSAFASLLATSYGWSMVTQGQVAVAFDQLSGALAHPSISRPVKTAMEACYTNLSDALEQIQDLSDLLGELESVSSGDLP